MKPDNVSGAQKMMSSNAKFLVYQSDDDIIFQPNYSGTGTTASTVLTAGKWTHVACTWDTSLDLASIYIDGKLTAQGEDLTADKTGAEAIYIGRKHDGFNEYDGYLDEIRLWEDIRTEAEIRTDMFHSHFYPFTDATCDTHTNTTVDGMTSTALIKAGMYVSGSGIPVGAYVASVTSSTAFVLSAAATSTLTDTTLTFNGLADTGSLFAAWGLNEGATTTSDNSQGDAGNDLTVVAGGWAGAGTFDEGTDSTLVFTGTSTWTMGSYLSAGVRIKNMTVNAPLTLKSIDNGYGAVYMTGAKTFTLGAAGTVTSTDTETLYFATADSTIDVSANTDGLAALEALRFRHVGNINLPELTTERIKVEVSGGTVTSTGDNTITQELEVSSGTTFNANGNTITVKKVDINTGTLKLSNSTMTFTSVLADAWNMTSDSTLIAGPTTTINGYLTSDHTPITLPEAGGFEVVGDIKWLKAASGTDLTVIGSVTNCSFVDSTANIRQFHHTIDTQQLLDADEAGDDDMKLPRPSLDNALQLQTGG
jgi:hypothetical protein